MNRIFITCRATKGGLGNTVSLEVEVKISPNAFSSSVKARQCRGGSRAVSEEVKRYLGSRAAVGRSRRPTGTADGAGGRGRIYGRPSFMPSADQYRGGGQRFLPVRFGLIETDGVTRVSIE
ncbi:hypothetical protein ACVXHB_06830 [Escherichia coli]